MNHPRARPSRSGLPSLVALAAFGCAGATSPAGADGDALVGHNASTPSTGGGSGDALFLLDALSSFDLGAGGEEPPGEGGSESSGGSGGSSGDDGAGGGPGGGVAPPTAAPTASPTAAPPTAAPTAAPTAPPTAAPTDAPPECGAELCNGADDDCNGTIDDHGVCGPWVERNCRIFLGWADSRQGPAGVAASWGPCPAQAEGRIGEDVVCNSTRGDGTFLNLDLNGEVNDDDQLGIALLCDAGADAGVGQWIQSHCALFLGHADDGGGAADGSASWGACPASVQSNAGNQRCTSSGFDGQFRPLNLTGDVDDNDELGVAWLCRDDADAARAQASQAAVEVFLGQADENSGPPTGSPTWGSCPGAASPARGQIRCIGSGGDGTFHKMRLEGDVDGNDDLGLALRARPVR